MGRSIPREENTLWLNVEERIASFHPVEGYDRMVFHDHSQLLCFLRELQQRYFRFM